MSDEVNLYQPPAAPIGIPAPPRRRLILRWIAAIFCGLLAVVPLYFSGLATDTIINKVRANGWRDTFLRYPGPGWWCFVVLSILMTAASGMTFLYAGRRFVVGRPLWAVLWFLAAIGLVVSSTSLFNETSRYASRNAPWNQPAVLTPDSSQADQGQVTPAP
jgi:hypothetical protein